MKDLTKGAISTHLFILAAPLAVTMLTQIAYQLIDLYFITRISVAATAGVNAAANAMFICAALAQVLTVGTTPLVAQSVGRKDREGANVALNQSLLLSLLIGALTAALLYLITPIYMRTVAADEATASAGAEFLYALLPSIAFTFPMATLTAGLQGTGAVRPIIFISTTTIVVNCALAPVLIIGWGTGAPLGVMGAGLATSVSAAVGLALFVLYIVRLDLYLSISIPPARPQFSQWRRIVAIGAPAAVDFCLMFLVMSMAYYMISAMGATTQAGFGIGSRVLQILLLPGIAIGFAVAPIAAQNFGAGQGRRVRETLQTAAIITTLIMVPMTLIVQRWAEAIVGAFESGDPAVIAAGAQFLRLISWSFVAQALVYVCTSLFQGLGNTLPSLIGSMARFVGFSLPVLVARRSGFQVEQVWGLMTVSIVLQAVVNIWLLNMELKKRLAPSSDPPSALSAPARSVVVDEDS